jgi:predicted MFS family arabinose efflux permease
VLIAARAVAGAASGALLPTTLVYLGDTVEFRFRQRAVARVLAAAALGAGAAMALAGLLGRWTSWRLPLLAIAVLAPAVAVGMRGLPEPPRAAGTLTIRQVLRGHPALLALLVFALFEGAAILGFFTFFAPALQAHGASSAVAGLVVGVYGGATAAGSWLLGRLPQRLIPRLPLIVGGAAMVAGYLTAAMAQTTWTVLAASALLGVSFALFHSTFQTWATQLLPAARGVVTSLFASSVFTGAAVGSAWAGGLESRHAFGTLFAIAAALAGVVTVAGTVARLRSRPREVTASAAAAVASAEPRVAVARRPSAGPGSDAVARRGRQPLQSWPSGPTRSARPERRAGPEDGAAGPQSPCPPGRR